MIGRLIHHLPLGIWVMKFGMHKMNGCIDSLSVRNLMRSLGEAGEIEPETESFLLDNDIDYSEFSADVLECLPKDLPWSIPEVCVWPFL